MTAQPTLDPEKLVFLDEAGVDIAMSRSYGWAPPGETPVIERPARGRRISLIGAIAMDGVRALRRVEVIMPPYSPELNPIEMTWAWLKKFLRDAPPRKLPALRERVDQLWDTVSVPLCMAWIRHCGYRPT